jgi:WD40 repeat protein
MVASFSGPFRVEIYFCYNLIIKSPLLYFCISFLYFVLVLFVRDTKAMDFVLPKPVQISTTLQANLKANNTPLSSPNSKRAKPILEIEAGGHKSIIRDVFFTKDEKFLVSASDDKTVRVTEIESGETVRIFRGQTGKGNVGKVFAAALSPSNQYLAVGGWLHNECPGKCGNIRIYNFLTGKLIKLFEGHSNITLDLAFSFDSKFLISGNFDRTARIWEVKTGQILKVLGGHSDQVSTVAFSPDGSLVVTGSHDKTLKLRDVLSGKIIAILNEHEDKVDAAVFTPNGRYLLTGSRDKTVRLWDGRSGQYIKILGVQGSNVASISISSDSKKVLTGSAGDTSINNVFAIPSGKRLAFFSKHDNITLATDISLDGKLAVTGGGVDQEIYLWDIVSGKIKKKFVGRGRGVFGIGFSGENSSIAWRKIRSCPGRNCLPFKVKLLKNFFLRNDVENYHLKLGTALDFDSDYFQAIESIGPWSIRTKNKNINPTLQVLKDGNVYKEITRTSFSGYDHRSITLTKNGLRVISGGANGYLASYDTASGKLIHNFIGHTGDVWAVAVSPDGLWLVSGSTDQTVRLWDINTGKPLITIFHGTDDEWVAWTPEGFYDASPNGDRYVGWRVNKGHDKAAEYYRASQFRRYLYRPDIIRDTLELSSSEEAVKKAGMDNITVADLIQRAPVDVSIASTRFRDSGEAEISIKLGRNRTTVPERITLYVNGAQVLAQAQRRMSDVRPGASLTYIVDLPKSRNHIRVLVENQWAENGDETWVENPHWKEQGQPKGTLFVNAIGISRYPKFDKKKQLSSPPLDAINISNRFKKLEGKLYEKVVINLLTDTDGQTITLADIESHLEKQKTKAGPEDTTLIFLAGHGVTDSNEEYQFLTADSEIIFGEKGSLYTRSGTSFDWTRLHKILDQTLGRRLVFIDTCEAGEVLNVTQANIQKLVKDIHDVNAVIYTGASRQQKGRETKRGGVFTLAMVDGLDGKAHYRHGNLLFTSLREYVDREVPKRNIEILRRKYSRGVLVVKNKSSKLNQNPNFDYTQHPVAVIPKGMKDLIIFKK